MLLRPHYHENGRPPSCRVVHQDGLPDSNDFTAMSLRDTDMFLVCKSEVQSVTSLIGSRLEIFDFFLCSQCIPLLISLLVAPGIIDLTKYVQNNIQYTHGHQNAIAAAVFSCQRKPDASSMV